MATKANNRQIDAITPSPEHELVLAVISLNRTHDERISEIMRGEIDWALFFRLAIQEGILPLCCQRLLTLPEDGVPQGKVSQLEGYFQANTQNNLRLTWKLAQCVGLLSENGIQCIILKGPILALQAYGGLNLRQFSDLDILIHQADFPHVYNLLVKAGYAPQFKLDDRQKKYLVWSDNHFSFDRQGDILEVHWEIGSRENIHPLNSEQMWQELSTIQLLDKSCYALSLENTIQFLCFHGAKHGWKQLKWILDLAFISRLCTENTWSTVIEQARHTALFRQICLGLLLAEDLVEAELPARIHALINTDRHAQFLADRVKSRLFEKPNHPTLLGDYMFYLQTRERWQDQLQYLFDLIILPKKPDWRMVSLPENLYFLYYLFRPIRLFYLAGKAIFTMK